GVHDRNLVRADLDGPAVERDQVEGRADRRDPGREPDVERSNPRPHTRSEPESNRGDGDSREPEPEHPSAVAVRDVDDERQSPNREPDPGKAEWSPVLERTALTAQRRNTDRFLFDDPHEKSKSSLVRGKLPERCGSHSTRSNSSA